MGICSSEMVAEQIFSLPAPWPGRFLQFVAQMAGKDWDERVPALGEVEVWLREDRDLCCKVRLMLRAWGLPRQQS